MTRRPDSQDRAKHRHCVCGDREPCSCLSPPSQGWRWQQWLPLLRSDAWLLFAAVRAQLNAITEEIKTMAVSTEKILADIQTLVAGGQAKDALIKQLQDALASADADKAQAVADAVAADDAGIQAQIDAADAVAAEYLNPPVVEPPAADDGSGSVA